MAPEGAQLQEEAEAQEMAAFVGTEKSGKYRTAAFTGLAVNRLYLFVSSTETGSGALEPKNLQYISYGWSDGNGEFTFSYIPRTNAKSIVQLYGPEKVTLTVESEYLTFHGTELTRSFQVETNGDEYWLDYQVETADGTWDSEKADELYEVTREGKQFTVTYVGDLDRAVTAYLHITYPVPRNRPDAVTIRLDHIPDSQEVKSASLGETAATRNLYDSNPTELPVFLKLEEKEQAAADTFALDAGEETKNMITKAEFAKGTPELLTKFFAVSVKDDHTLLLDTKPQNWDDAQVQKDIKALKSSYANLKFELTIDGKTEPITVTNALKLTVQKKLPTVKAAAVTLNPYYRTRATYITYTGGTVIGGQYESADYGKLPVKFVDEGEGWQLELDGKATLTKAVSGNVKVAVSVEGYLLPVSVTIPVKVETKAPSLKLSTSSMKVSSVAPVDEIIDVSCTAKDVTLKDLAIGEVSLTGADADKYDVEYLDGDCLHLTSKEDVRPGGAHKLTVNIEIGDKDMKAALPLTIHNQDPAAKLNVTSISVNTAAGEEAKVYYTISGLQEELTAVTAEPKKADAPLTVNTEILSFRKGTQTGEITVKGEDGKTGVYAVALKYGDKTLATLSVTLTKDRPEVTLEAESTLNAYDDNTWVKLIPTLKNTSGRLDGEPTWTVNKTTGKKEDVTDSFTITQSKSGDYWALRSAPGKLIPAGKYTVTYSAGTWTDSQGKTKEIKNEVTVTVKSTKNLLSIKGKVNVLDSSSHLDISTTIVKYGEVDGIVKTLLPDVEIWTTGKDVYKVDGSDTHEVFDFVWEHEELLHLIPNGGDLAAGKYTVKMTYPSIMTGTGSKKAPLEVTADFTVSRSPAKQKTSVSTVTIHPNMEQGAEVSLWKDRYEPNAKSTYKICNASGKAIDTDLIQVKVSADAEYVDNVTTYENPYLLQVVGTGVVPKADTTLKIKLIPDVRAKNSYSWLTVKVLGEKSVAKYGKFTLTTRQNLDPSYGSAQFFLTGTYNTKAFAGKMYSNVTVQKYNAESGKYEEVGYVAGLSTNNNSIMAHGNVYEREYKGVQPGGKYRVVVKLYGDNARTKVIATATKDLTAAYGKNKFTAQPLTLYKADPNNHMTFGINATDDEQIIERIVVKDSQKNGFAVSQSCVTNSYGREWRIWYTGDAAKLKTTTLTLQIFLKGNNTQKPNATMRLKVNVK